MSQRCGYAISFVDRTPIFYEIDPGDTDRNSASPRSATTSEPIPILLSDGIGCDGYVWKYIRRSLRAHTIVHWHYRGHGRTRNPHDPKRLSIADLADDLAAVMEDACLPRAALLGHSMGVQVILEAYRRHPDKVAGLALICGAPEHPLRTFRGTAILESVLPAVQRAVTAAPRLLNRLTRTLLPTRLSYAIATRIEVNGRLLEEADFMPYLDGLSRVDLGLFVELLRQAGEHSALDVLPDIQVPALVIAGGRDGFTPAELSHRMHLLIPGAELLNVEDGSHTAPLERPELVATAIRAWIARVEGH